jgi:hypothetical protein
MLNFTPGERVLGMHWIENCVGVTFVLDGMAKELEAV